MKKLTLFSVLLMNCLGEPIPGPESSAVAVADDCVEEGKRCGGSESCCAGYCDITAYVYGYCRAFLKEGEDCSDDAQCTPGLFCDNEGYAYWQCARPRPTGEYCTASKQCASERCGNDYQCDP